MPTSNPASRHATPAKAFAAPTPHAPSPSDRRRGLLLGLAGVVAFSGTLPATRVAVTALDPVFVGLGRALVAAILAAIVLAATHSPVPPRALWPRLGVVALGVVAGWPVLSAFAMRHVPAAHGAVVAGLLPLATALAGAWLAHERPRRKFWIWALFGSAVVIAFALWEGGGALQLADLLLAGAVAAAAIGYAEGARLARIIGGWQVICWVLILAAPFVAIPTWLTFDARSLTAPWPAWAGFAYVAVISQFLGFFAWYRGLALGGIAAVGQTQLLQPFLTIIASAWLLAEPVTAATYIAAALVIAAIAMGRRA
jgi:drug/metabolite transporter (DMT)-like permease